MSKVKVFVRKNEQILGISVIVIILAIVITLTNRGGKEYISKIRRFSALTAGHFEKLEGKSNMGLVGTYSFKVQWMPYTAMSTNARYAKLGRDLYTHTFPVIYDSTNPNNCKILVFFDDFEQFNIPYPDSLAWAEIMVKYGR